MKIINLKEWLDLFNLDNISYNTFLKQAKIKGSNETYFRDKIKSHKLRKMFYDCFIIRKKEYLVNFYNRSLKISDNNIDLNNLDNNILSNSVNKKYKSLIRNLYFKEILLLTKTDLKGLRPFLEVLLDLNNKLLIDYKLLTPSAIKYIKSNQYGSVLSAYYFRASIMNPTIPYILSKTILKGRKIFTPTLGWSSYMHGFLSNDYVKEYIGTDVIDNVCKTTYELGKHLYPDKKIKIYNSPSENLMMQVNFKVKYRKYFDVIFFSPPYFKLEIYPGKNQSINKYKDYNSWLNGYWEKTIQLCKYVLKNNGKMCYIVSSYGKYNNLVSDMNKITNKYFNTIKIYQLGNSKFFNNNSEKIHIFKPIG